MYRVNLRMFPSTAAAGWGPARLLHGDHGEYRRRKLGSEVEIRKRFETSQGLFLKRENTRTKYHISIQRLARHDC